QQTQRKWGGTDLRRGDKSLFVPICPLPAFFHFFILAKSVERSAQRSLAKCQQPKNNEMRADKVRRPADPAEYVALMRFGSRPLRRALFLMRRVGIRTKEL